MYPRLWINIQAEDITSQQTREGMLRRYFSVVFTGIQTLLIMFVAFLFHIHYHNKLIQFKLRFCQ